MLRSDRESSELVKMYEWRIVSVVVWIMILS